MVGGELVCGTPSTLHTLVNACEKAASLLADCGLKLPTEE
jgi:hypothetical protein